MDVNARIESHAARGGISIHLGGDATLVSPEWRLGEFGIQFVKLIVGESFELGNQAERTFVKVVAGRLQQPRRWAFPAPGTVACTAVTDAQISAAEDSILCVIRTSTEPPSPIADMAQLDTAGPMSELLIWQTFDEKFGAVTDMFKGLEAHMLPGFHLLDADGAEIAYVHFWTTGKGVNVSTHNHAHPPSEHAPAFAETHLVLCNGTGSGAMYQCDAPGAETRQRTPLQSGEEHGPFFHIDPASGTPRMCDNGAVDYPWHGWQGGADDNDAQSYDLVTAFEINPVYVSVT